MSKSTSRMHTGANQLTHQHQKDAEAHQLAADIKAFKAAGGKIEVLGHTPLRPLTKKKPDPALRKRGPAKQEPPAE